MTQPTDTQPAYMLVDAEGKPIKGEPVYLLKADAEAAVRRAWARGLEAYIKS